MQIADIPRLKVGGSLAQGERPPAGMMDGERMELAIKAETTLGYRRLKNEMTGTPETPVESIKELGVTLLALDIEVLDMPTVLRYQHEMVRALNQEFTDNLLAAGRTHRYFTESYGFASAKWETTGLSEYAEPIPEFVLSKAVQIKEKLPAVEFYVQHLNQPKEDPFLIAKHGKEIYIVEVWQEPRFEGRVR
jgi:hypothetical protein